MSEILWVLRPRHHGLRTTLTATDVRTSILSFFFTNMIGVYKVHDVSRGVIRNCAANSDD